MRRVTHALVDGRSFGSRAFNKLNAHRDGARLLLTIALATAGALGLPDVAKAQGALSTPTQIEVDFWKSAEKIGTPDAFRAYIERFPAGIYVPLARAALGRTDGPGPSTAPRFSIANASGAVEIRPGDRLRGVGPVTVGWAGSKKQVVIPSGEWTVLAAVDHASTHAYRPAQMTTIALGQFKEGQVTSLLLATFNRTPVLSTNTWTDASSCETVDHAALLQTVEGPFTLRQCLLVKERSAPQSLAETAIVRSQLTASLDALSAKMRGFNLRTTIYIVDGRSAYLHLERLDCIGAAVNGDCPSLAMARSDPKAATDIEDRLKMARSYLASSAQGFVRSIAADDLSPTP